MRTCKYTKDEFVNSVNSSLSVRSALQKLNLKMTGGNYKSFYNKVKEYDLNISHFTGSGWNTGSNFKPFGKKYKLEDILVIDFNYSSHKLRNRLLKEGYKIHICEQCNNTTWNDKQIPLELHHINGIHNDNRIENLQLLCANCHAQTTSYCRKKSK